MTGLEIAAALLRASAFVAFYFFIGFGPGVILGLIMANKIYAQGKPTLMQSQRSDIAQAAKHNSQWDPKHPRWQ